MALPLHHSPQALNTSFQTFMHHICTLQEKEKDYQVMYRNNKTIEDNLKSFAEQKEMTAVFLQYQTLISLASENKAAQSQRSIFLSFICTSWRHFMQNDQFRTSPR